MNITELKNEGLLREFKAVFAETEIQQAIQKRVQELSKTKKLPGFRPGKVPADLLMKKFGDEAKANAAGELVEMAAREILAKHKFRLAMRPSSNVVKYEASEMECHIRCELIPEIAFPDFQKLKFESYEPQVADKDIDEAIANLQMELASLADAEEGSAIGKDDVVEADLKFDIPEIENGQAEQNGVRFEMGRNKVLPAIEEKLLGVKAGADIQVDTVFPEYADANLVGKRVVYDIRINKILKRVPHPVDDMLAKKIGAQDASKIREQIQHILSTDWSEHTFTLTKRSLFDALDAAVKFDLPPTLMAQEMANLRKSMQQNAEQKLSKEDEKQAESLATRRVKLGLFLSELSDKHNIDVKTEEVQAELMRRVQANPTRAKDILDYYKNTLGAVDQIRGPLLENAVVRFIVAQAGTKPVLLTKDEINKRMGEVRE